MPSELLRKINRQNLRRAADPKNIGLYVFLLMVLAISWSGIKTIQTNYELQKEITSLKQQNNVLQLQNENTVLKNQYLQTDQYLDLAARQDLGLAGPGEQVLLVPKAAALKYVDLGLASGGNTSSSNDNRPKYLQNLDAWKNFLLGRNITSD